MFSRIRTSLAVRPLLLLYRYGLFQHLHLGAIKLVVVVMVPDDRARSAQCLGTLTWRSLTRDAMKCMFAGKTTMKHPFQLICFLHRHVRKKSWETTETHKNDEPT